MAVETLKIEITADNKDAVASLQAMTNMLAKFQRALKSATDPSQVQYLQRNIDFLNGKIANLKNSMGIADKAVKNNTQAWLNWGRVVQDAPYGLNGIANNLTQLVPAVGALGFAFSAVVSAMTFSQVGFGAWTKGSKKAKEEADELNKSIAEETVSFQTLYRATLNANAPLEARKKAVKDLRDQYGNYLKNFSDEEIMAGKATTAYNLLTDSILKVARAKAAQDKITELFTKRLGEETKLANIAAKAEKQAADNAARRAQRGNISVRQEELGQGIESAAVTFAKASNEALKVATSIQQIDTEIQRLNTSIDNNQVKPFTEDAKKLASSFDKAKWEAEELNKALQARLALPTALSRGNGIVSDPRQSGMQNAQPNAPQGQGRTAQLMEMERTVLGIDEALRVYNEYAAQATSITNVFASSFTDLSSALLQGQSLGTALGNVFRKLAADIAAAAIKALIFKTILGAITGGAGAGIGAAGGAKTGFGSIFKSLLGIKLAAGGVTQGPTPALIGEAGPEAVLPLDRLGAFVDRAARIGANSMGNNQPQMMMGDFKLSGQDLILSLQRAGFNNNLKR